MWYVLVNVGWYAINNERMDHPAGVELQYYTLQRVRLYEEVEHKHLLRQPVRRVPVTHHG
jgi:hypothetical protein